MIVRVLASLGLIALILSACQAPAAATPADTLPRAWPAPDWPAAAPEEQGMDSETLTGMFTTIQTEKLKLHGLLVIRSGHIVAESYVPPYSPEIRHTVQSNTKAVLGALLGIAIAEGKIKSADQKLLDFFPDRKIQNLDDRKRSITLKHLLTMTSGLDCADDDPGMNSVYQSGNRVQAILDLPMANEPGREWIYCSAGTHLLSAALQQAVGMSTRAYANQALFGPIGIPEVSEPDWGIDSQSVSDGMGGLYLTPRELARFGYLYLRGGEWAGAQIVPSEWVAESTRPLVETGRDPYLAGAERRFGYLFSVFPKLRYYGYLGRAGQELFVIPEKELVVVFTAATKVGEEPALLSLVNDHILPAARSNSPLPADPQAVARLRGVEAISADTPQPPEPLPPIAAQISGLTYSMEPNPNRWESMTFYFTPEAPEARIRIPGSPDFAVGLDGVYRFTPVPIGRPVGLRARWTGETELLVEQVTLGEFMEVSSTVTFTTDRLTIASTLVNFGSPPLLQYGTAVR